jgi:RHS repeat-associated protein
MNKIYSALCYLFLISNTFLLAQPVNNQVKDVTMPPPNAASLGKYGDIPVGYYSGIPNIDIPIYNVKEGGLNVPVSLSYHAGGVKIGETSSCVGLGWSLQAGGLISRTIIGKADEVVDGYFTTGSTLSYGGGVLPKDSYVQPSDLANGNRDGEPDVFSFSFGGYNGKFYFDRDKNLATPYYDANPVLVPMQDLKIDILYSATNSTSVNGVSLSAEGSSGSPHRIAGFIVTTSNGVKYEFGTYLGDLTVKTIEFTTMASQFTVGFANTWYLKRVIAPDTNESIIFEYEPEYYRYNSRSSIGSSIGQTVGAYKANWTDVRGFRLSKIKNSSNTTEVAFIPNPLETRQDFIDMGQSPITNTARSLKTIKITAGTYCKEFTLNQSYFSDISSNKTNSADCDKRLKLDNVQEKSCDGSITVPPYTFNYYGNNNSLPNRLSSAIDHWGYYNGAETNPKTGYNIPFTQLRYNNIANQKVVVTEGNSNRESNESFMRLGTLNKITYPTGGSTTFDLEANSVYDDSKYDTYTLLNSMSGGYKCSSQSASTQMNVTLSGDIESYYYEWGTSPSAAYTPSCCNPSPSVWLAASSNGGSASFAPSCYALNTNAPYEIKKGYLIDLLSNLQSGANYTFSMSISNADSYFKIFKIEKVPLNQNKQVGGLRVAKITTHDGISVNNDVIKTYDYTQYSTPSSPSTGKLFHKPLYGLIYKGAITTPNSGDDPPPTFPLTQGQSIYFCQWINLNTTPPSTTNPFAFHLFFDYSVVPLGTFDGYHLRYSKVKENLNGSGFKVYEYENNRDYDIDINYAPITPAPPLPQNGNLKILTDLKSDGTTTISSDNNSLHGDAYSYNSGIFLKGFSYPVVSCSVGATTYFVKSYQIRTRPVRLALTTSFLDGVTTTTNYTYGSNNHLQPTKVTVTNSDGKVTESQTDYSFDVTNTSVLDATTKTAMVNRFILTPIETRTYVAGVQVGGSRTIYKQYANATGLQTTAATDFPRPFTFHNYEMTWNQNDPVVTPAIATGAWVLKGTINGYSIPSTTVKGGLPISFTKDGWLPETYTWNNAGLITQRKYKDFIWNYAYHAGTTLVSRITNPDGQFVDYTYDPLMRLKENIARGGNVKATYAYTYPTLNANGTIATFGNIKQTTTFTAVAGSPLSTQESFTYFDGLGRNLQTVKKGAFNGLDQISAVGYDNQGRVNKSYETFVGGYNSGNYQSPDGKPFTLTEYFADPLSRTMKVTPPNWLATTTQYGTNGAASNDPLVKKYNYESAAVGSYAIGDLMRTTVIDANGNKTSSYKDKKGRLICMRKSDAAGYTNTDTYYVYDDKDRLVKVITPEADWNSSELNYYYNYQANDLLARKKVPGKVIELFQYNKKDLPALYQDGFLRTNLRWMASSYDDYGRLLIKGINSNWDKDALTFTNKIIENTYGTSSTELDKLKISKVMALNVADPVVTVAAANTILQKTFTYDTYGRVSNIAGNNHLLPTNFSAETMAYTYDFGDNILKEDRLVAHGTGPSNSIVNTRTFDSWARLKSVTQSIDGAAATTLNNIQYSSKNQVVSKTIGGGLQQVDYAYLENGLLKSINGEANLTNSSFMNTTMLSNFTTPTFSNTATSEDLFQEVMSYNSVFTGTGANFAAQNNGNISQAIWQVKGRTKQYYNYTYDYLDRLTNARHGEFNTVGSTVENNYFGEKSTYDARGNMLTLQRQGMVKGTSNFTNGLIDNLTYNYNVGTNLISRITDVGNTTEGFRNTSTNYFAYDNNGNMTYDPNKNLTITYNHLNLPSRFTFMGNNTIDILYDAAGQKLRKTVKANGVVTVTQDYLGGIEIKNNRLEAIYNEEGRAYNTAPAYPYVWRYEYNLKDHLGNTRVSFCDKNKNGIIENQTELLQETHYYPFGMAFNGAWYADNTAPPNKYLYNGKELNEEFGLNLSDYGARWYDAAIGRWWSVDPLAEKYVSINPYNYGLNNPIRFTDPDGMDVWDEVNALKKKVDDRNNAETRKAEGEQWVNDTRPGNGEFSNSGGSKENPHANKSTVYYVNATNNKNINTKAIIDEARKILRKSGIDINFVPISIKKARSQQYWAYNDMFIAIVNQKTAEPGKTRIKDNYMIEGDLGYPDNMYTPQGFATYVNYQSAKVVGYKGEKNYYTGYLVAHEILHQLLAKSGVNATHTNHVENLNQDGRYTNIPLSSSSKLRPVETIIPEHLNAIKNYLEQKP